MLTISSFLYNMGGCIIKLQLSEFLVHENLDTIIRMKLVTSLKLANIDIEIIAVWEKQIKHVTIMISIFDMGLIKCGLYWCRMLFKLVRLQFFQAVQHNYLYRDCGTERKYKFYTVMCYNEFVISYSYTLSEMEMTILCSVFIVFLKTNFKTN